MILFVDIEHPSVSLDAAKGPERRARLARVARRFERLSGRNCEIVHYTRLPLDRLLDGSCSTLLLSGQGTLWPRYDFSAFQPLFRLIRGNLSPHLRSLPILGICGGHQLIAMAYGAKVEPMRWLGDGPPERNTREGWLLETGFQQVHVCRSDPIFHGLPDTLVVHESHYDHVTSVPRGFLWLAESRVCRVQAMRHRTRPLYGLQFHPERWNPAHPHGRTILQNFFRLAL